MSQTKQKAVHYNGLVCNFSRIAVQRDPVFLMPLANKERKESQSYKVTIGKVKVEINKTGDTEKL